jgi:hypothetical protein
VTLRGRDIGRNPDDLECGTGGPRERGYPDRVLPVLKYTVLRLALFAVALLVLFLLGARGLLALLLAAAASMGLSYVLLRGPRDQVAVQIDERVRRRTGRRGGFGQGIAGDAAVEDAALDGRAGGDGVQEGSEGERRAEQ